MRVDGKQISLKNKISLSEFLTIEEYDLQRIAVEKNGNIVPKKNYDTEILCNNDKLEIVHFVGGG